MHEPESMLVKLAHLNTDENRRAYITTLTKAMREKYGMQTKRDVRFGKSKKKTGAKSKPTQKQFALNFAKHVHPNGALSPAQTEPRNLKIERLADIAMQDKDLVARFQKLADELPSFGDVFNFKNEDDVTAEYVKLDDDYKALQLKYDDLEDSVSELKREIIRLQVIVTYLEGKK